MVTACYQPPEFPDAFIENSLGELLGSVVTFKCVTGYLLRGNPSVVCQPNGMWSQRDFTCNGECLVVILHLLLSLYFRIYYHVLQYINIIADK